MRRMRKNPELFRKGLKLGLIKGFGVKLELGTLDSLFSVDRSELDLNKGIPSSHPNPGSEPKQVQTKMGKPNSVL